MLVAVQLSVLGLYLPPVFRRLPGAFHPRRSFRCRSTLPCGIGQWARWWCWWLSNCRCSDCISRQCLIVGCHPRRSFHCQSTLPCDPRAAGALVMLVAVHVSSVQTCGKHEVRRFPVAIVGGPRVSASGSRGLLKCLQRPPAIARPARAWPDTPQSPTDRCRVLQRVRATPRAVWCVSPCDPFQAWNCSR